MRPRTSVSLLSALLVSSTTWTAAAQYGAPYGQPNGGQPYGGQPYGGQPYGGQPYGGQYGGQPYGGYGYPQPVPAKSSQPRSTPLEVGYLYGASAVWGVGTGIWVDALAGIDDPGLRLIAPAVLGLAAPAGVFFLDSPPLPRGLPSAVATGMLIGAGEGLGIASYQYVTATKADEWGFLGLATSEVVGSTVGGAAGFAFYYLLRPRPQANLFLASSAFWGSLIGTEFGGGASNGEFVEANDSISLGGLIGFNLAVAGAVGVSAAWTPSWNQLGWMWGGLGIATVASLPVYIFYAGGDYDARRGLIFQGVAGLLGVGAGALIGSPDRRSDVGQNDHDGRARPPFARLLGGGIVPHEGGVAVQVRGELW
jgi:hypothetical protein